MAEISPLDGGERSVDGWCWRRRETEKVRGIEKVERGKKERGIVEGDGEKESSPLS